MMYLLGFILALLAGFHLTRNPLQRGGEGLDQEGKVDVARVSYGETSRVHREGQKLFMGPVVLHLGPFIALLVLFTLVIFIIDMTYGYYIGSFRSFLAFALAASILGLVISTIIRVGSDQLDLDDMKGGFSGTPKAVLLPFILVIVLMFAAIGLGGALATICVVPILIILVILAFVFIRARRAAKDVFGGGSKERRGTTPDRLPDLVRITVAVLALVVLIVSSFLPYIMPSELNDKNPLYESIDSDQVRGENPNTLEDPQEVRVVSWLLATQYLQRSYGDSAAFLDSTSDGMLQYTDPGYVNGRFVWVNAPYYEAWKWFGGKKVPFFVYVENDPQNVSTESTGLTHKVEMDLETHGTRITWAKRLEQLCFDRYAAQYEIAQIRITVDDEDNPYWIIYLAERDTWFNMLHLKQLLVVNAMKMSDNTEYAVDSEDIPDWLEVVYPDWYVYDWVRFWAEHRLGMGYRWFDKAHLYEPDDYSARFIVIQGNTYWQIPLVQKSSHVLGGYVWVDTRTGEATFFNREDRSLADKDTVEAQVQKYLASGALGYQRLDIHEGYLYPIRLYNGTVREAYVFPLYAGLTVQKYAIVDAEDYTSEPYIENSLALALARYKARSGGGGGVDLVWQEFSLTSGHAEGEEAVLSVDNSTLTNATFVLLTEALDQGLLPDGDDEMREVKLAVAAWGRGEDVTLWMVMDEGIVVDVDWDGSDLVTRLET